MLPPVIACPDCSGALLQREADQVSCACGRTTLTLKSGVHVPAEFHSTAEEEKRIRDLQAGSYLAHSKFPTQVATFKRWLGEVLAARPHTHSGSPPPIALDLGCGPGPYTRMLQEAGFTVIAVDFSIVSLQLNATHCHGAVDAAPVCFVQADLNALQFVPDAVDLILMADFLQHLGGRQQRARLLREAARALKPGAPFFLSCFNLNAWNYLKGDVHGAFADGAIRYERLTMPNVLADLPPALVVLRISPLNIMHTAAADRVCAALPGARYLARMMVMTGFRDNPQ